MKIRKKLGARHPAAQRGATCAVQVSFDTSAAAEVVARQMERVLAVHAARTADRPAPAGWDTLENVR